MSGVCVLVVGGVGDGGGGLVAEERWRVRFGGKAGGKAPFSGVDVGDILLKSGLKIGRSKSMGSCILLKHH